MNDWWDEAISEEHIHKYDLPLKGRKPICNVHIGFFHSFFGRNVVPIIFPFCLFL